MFFACYIFICIDGASKNDVHLNQISSLAQSLFMNSINLVYCWFSFAIRMFVYQVARYAAYLLLLMLFKLQNCKSED